MQTYVANPKSPSVVTSIEWCFGYGGLHLGLRRVIPNLRLIAASEIEAYACANMVSKMEAGLLDPAPVWTDLKTFPCEAFRDRVSLFLAGYPCQPFSAAGKRLGASDPRHLWPYVLEGIRIMRPLQCFFENVEGHISLGLREVLTDLARLGYRVENDRKEPTWGIFSAAEVGASHVRKRVFILAQLADSSIARSGQLHPRQWSERSGASVTDGSISSDDLANPSGVLRGPIERSQRREEFGSGRTSLANPERRGHAGLTEPCGRQDNEGSDWSAKRGETMAHPNGVQSEQFAGRGAEWSGASRERPCDEPAGSGSGFHLSEFPPGPADLAAWRQVLEVDPSLEPAVCSLAHVRPFRVDELRLAGNGVVPATAERAYLVLNKRMNK